MTLATVDARFLLPILPRTAAVLGQLDGWRDGLEQAGVEVGGSGSPDLVVAPASRAREAGRLGAATMIVLGTASGRASRRAGYRTRVFLPRPRSDRADLFVPLDRPAVAAYGARQWGASQTALLDARRRLVSSALGHGLLPWAPGALVVATRSSAPPAMLAGAPGALVPEEPDHFLTPGQGDTLSRNVFHVFGPGDLHPSRVVKFARVPGYSRPFERDAAGLAVASAAAGVVRAHAPTLLGRFDVEGIAASVETAAVGSRLRSILVAPGRTASKLRRIDAVARWTVDVATGTAQAPPAVHAVLERLVSELTPEWPEVVPALARRLEGVPAVLQHSDLGSWNIIASETDFTIVDWEDARASGLPLWDLVYFLTDALAAVDRVRPEERDDYAVRLYRGESRASQLLFRWIRATVAALSLPPDAVGPIVTLCWLRQSLATDLRGASFAEHVPGTSTRVFPAERLARVWLSTPGLGPEWRTWHE